MRKREEGGGGRRRARVERGIESLLSGRKAEENTAQEHGWCGERDGCICMRNEKARGGSRQKREETKARQDDSRAAIRKRNWAG